MDIFEVTISKQAEKQLRQLPIHVVLKLQGWIDGIKIQGLREIRKRPGYHDESLKGKRKGERSIRLSKAYRAIYTIEKDGTIQFIEIQEVTKHEY
jgi:proteic killer suppression protein